MAVRKTVGGLGRGGEEGKEHCTIPICNYMCTLSLSSDDHFSGCLKLDRLGHELPDLQVLQASLRQCHPLHHYHPLLLLHFLRGYSHKWEQGTRVSETRR